MLTYLDMTVLTYEIERGVEREDVRGAESSRTAGTRAEAGPGAGYGGTSAAAHRRDDEEAQGIHDEDVLDDSDEDTDGEDDDD